MFNKEIRMVKKVADRLQRRYFERPSKIIKVGFVGCGHHSISNLYPSLRYASVELVAVCAKHKESAERIGRQFGAEHFYDDYHEMFGRGDLDAVFICVNPELHAEIAIDALGYGLPVFVEKPPAPDAEEAKRVFEISQEKQIPVMVGFMKRFAPAYVEAKKIIQSSEFGRPNLITTKLATGPMKSEWEFLLHVGIHHLDLVRSFMGEVKNLSVEKFRKGDEISMTVNLRFENGAVGSLNFSSLQSWANHNEQVEIFGEESSVVVDNVVNLEYRRANISRSGIIPLNSEKNLVWRPNFSIPTDENQTFFLNGYAYEIQHFVNSIAKGEMPQPTIYDGHQALKLAEAIRDAKS